MQAVLLLALLAVLLATVLATSPSESGLITPLLDVWSLDGLDAPAMVLDVPLSEVASPDLTRNTTPSPDLSRQTLPLKEHATKEIPLLQRVLRYLPLRRRRFSDFDLAMLAYDEGVVRAHAILRQELQQVLKEMNVERKSAFLGAVEKMVREIAPIEPHTWRFRRLQRYAGLYIDETLPDVADLECLSLYRQRLDSVIRDLRHSGRATPAVQETIQYLALTTEFLDHVSNKITLAALRSDEAKWRGVDQASRRRDARVVL